MGNLIRGQSKNDNAQGVRMVTPNHLGFDTQHHQQYMSNCIKTTKYNILTFLPKNLFEQFHRFANLYFIFIVGINFVPQLQAFGKEIAMIPVVFVLLVTAIKDAYEDYRRYESDKRVNNCKCKIYDRQTSEYKQTQWQKIHVGDLVHLSCNEFIPADILLIKSSDPMGICYIETANIDGESNLKQREAVHWNNEPTQEFTPSSFKYNIECELPNPEIYHFHGALVDPTGHKILMNKTNLVLRGCVLRNTDFVQGIVLYAGHETKALMNNQGPRYKRSAVERQINKDVIWCVVILVFMCLFGAMGSGIWLDHFKDISKVIYIAFADADRYNPEYQGFLVFWTYIIILQVMIPLPLYVSIELVKLGQAYFMSNDQEMYDEASNRRMECRALNINEELGQVQYIFSDKTGTLTENKMVFKKCTIGGTDYPNPDDVDETMQHEIQLNSDLVIPNAALHSEVSRMSLHSLNSVQLNVSYQSKRIHEFFLLMAICNTVFVSPHSHLAELYKSNGNFSTNNTHASNGNITIKNNNKKKKNDKNNRDHADSDISQSGSTIGIMPNRVSNISENDTHLEVPYNVLDESYISESSMLSVKTLKTRYEAESPDELALVYAACSYGCRLLKRSMNTIQVWIPAEGEVDLNLLNVLPFDSDRKRMSVIVQDPLSGEIILYCKGADSAILNNLSIQFKDSIANTRIITETMNNITEYAIDGLRTLCMAKRVLTQQEYERWSERVISAEETQNETLLYQCYCDIETDLELLGATGIEDKLQDGVPETIAKLRAAGICVWILTGDKQETAVNIAYSCRLFTQDQEVITLNANNKEAAEELLHLHLEQQRRDSGLPQVLIHNPNMIRKTSKYKKKQSLQRNLALVIDGKTLAFVMDEKLKKKFLDLAYMCQSVVCCRATPGQKSEVVKLVRDKLKKLTLAIGDGANDVAMIQTANIGVGIVGQEGMQAVMSSDFAIARFCFLERLLLVHGHWCYDRLARMTLYMFYKNSAFVFLLFWFQLFNGFSGTTMMDQYYLILYTSLFTSLPPVILGIFDRDIPAYLLLSQPQLYKQGRESQMYLPHSFWVNIADALYQSLVIFFVPYMAYADSDANVWEFGTTITSSAVVIAILHLGIETKSWTWVHWVSAIFSLISFIAFALAFNAICVTCSGNGFVPYWVMEHTIVTSVHWFTVVLTCVVALTPRIFVRVMQTSFLPPIVLFERVWGKFTHNPLQEEDDAYVAYSSSEHQCTLTAFKSTRDGREMETETNIEGTQPDGTTVISGAPYIVTA